MGAFLGLVHDISFIWSILKFALIFLTGIIQISKKSLGMASDKLMKLLPVIAYSYLFSASEAEDSLEWSLFCAQVMWTQITQQMSKFLSMPNNKALRQPYMRGTKSLPASLRRSWPIRQMSVLSLIHLQQAEEMRAQGQKFKVNRPCLKASKRPLKIDSSQGSSEGPETVITSF